MIKLIIGIPYWKEDRALAERMLMLMSDLEAKPREDVLLVLMERYDSEAISGLTMGSVGRKFAWRMMTSKTRATGWPAGCNAMAYDLFEAVGGMLASLKMDFDPAFLFLEPDCVPIACDWIDQLLGAWRQARLEKKYIVGAWRDSGGPYGHINGNALYPPDLADLFPLKYTEGGIAWDAALAIPTHPYWHFSGLIRNRWHETELTPQQIETPWTGSAPPVLIHGCKDDSVYNYAVKKLL